MVVHVSKAVSGSTYHIDGERNLDRELARGSLGIERERRVRL
jgi:hypothetical protein